MKESRCIHFLLVLMVGFLPAKVGAQTSVPHEKFVYIESIGSPPPPTARSSQFSTPSGIAIDSHFVAPGFVGRKFYVADPQNNQVVVFDCTVTSSSHCVYDTATSTLNTLSCPVSVCSWEQTASPTWTLAGPTFVAVAPNGNIWISDTLNDVVVEVDPTGTVVAFAGAGPIPGTVVCTTGSTSPQCIVPGHPNQGQAPGKFFGPGPLVVDKTGSLYVADAAGGTLLGETLPSFAGANFRIQKFASNGTFLTSWGSFCVLSADGSGSTFSGTCDMSAPGATANGDGEFGFVAGLAIDDSLSVYATDDSNNRVQKFDSVGTFLLKWGGYPVATGDGQFNGPGGIAVDPLDQTVYVVDVFNNRIEQFDGSGNFLSKGGSMGAFEVQFNRAWGIATEPKNFALLCQNTGATDCIHGFAVSEQGQQGGTTGNTRVQVLSARPDQDNDGITDEIDTNPTVFSNDFNDAGLGFTTSGSIVDRGDQTFVIYNLLFPFPQDEIRVRTETFGGSVPLSLTFCGGPTLAFSAGTSVNLICSTPTVVVEEGPVGFRFVGSDGTVATATLNTGDSLSVDVTTSKITSNSGTIIVTLGGKSVSLSPGQSTFADTIPPTFNCLPAAADGIWHASNQIFRCTAQDNFDGLSSSSPASFSLMTTVPTGTETANASTNLQILCDLAGNCVTAGPISGNMIDLKPPTINVTTPANGATYQANQIVNAAYTCSDLGSGVVTCTGTVSNGRTIDTAPNGVLTPKTFVVSTTDKVGNSASQSIGYLVSCHYVALEISPSTVTRHNSITVTGTVMSCTSTAQTISVKFTLTGPLGPNACATTSTVMFTTPPFTIQAGTSLTKSFPFHIPKTVCPGTFTITSTTLVGGTPVDSTSALLVVQRHHREDDDDGEPEKTNQREDDGEPQ